LRGNWSVVLGWFLKPIGALLLVYLLLRWLAG